MSEIRDRQESDKQYRGLDLAGLAQARLDPNAVFVSADQGLCNLLGYRAEELLGLTWQDVFPDEPIEGVSNGSGFPVFVSGGRCRRRDGSAMAVDLRVSPAVDENGRPDGFFLAVQAGVGSDQSGEVASDPFVQTLKAEALSALAGGLAHEFNNILGSVTGFAELASMQAADQEPLGRYLRHIFRGGQRAKELVRQFLFFAREKEASAGEVLLVPIFKEALRFLRAAMPGHIELVQEIPSTPMTIHAAPLQIYLVIVGIGAWALEALQEAGGVLELILEEESLEDERTGDRIGPLARLTVSHRRSSGDRDSVRPADAPTLWRRFTENGLPILFSVAEANLGQVRMERSGEEDETWRVYFPLVDITVEPKRSIPVQEPSGRGCVLVIDKDTEMVEVAEEILTTLGFTVVAKVGCEAGIEAFKAAPESFDVVMASQFMSGMLGTELAVQVRKIRPGLPVIISIGFEDVAFFEEARRAGVRKVLVQPISMKDYNEALNQVLGNVRVA